MLGACGWCGRHFPSQFPGDQSLKALPTARQGLESRWTAIRSHSSGSVVLAMATAAELEFLPLQDALALCRLLSAKDDHAFERAAGRWVGRLTIERKLTVAEIQLAVGAMAVIGERSDDQEAERVLL